MNDLDEEIKSFLVRKTAELLNIDEAEIDWEADVDEFGYDSMTINKFCVEINAKLNISVQPAVFLEYPTLSEFSSYLKTDFYAEVEEALLQ